VSQGRHADLCQDSHWQDDQSLAERLHLRQVSASHDKSLPRTTSLRLRLVRGPRHTARVRPPAHARKRISTSYGDDSWRPCRRPAPARALNANLTSRAAITSPSTFALPHAKLSLRHSSTLYDVRGPRLRLTCGKTSKYSGRPRQTQTTRGEGQASRRNSSTQPRGGSPDKVSQLGADTPRRTATYDGAYQQPITVTLLYFPLRPSP
jgi:hypothetical protein